jgi:medium-chain acyl-[acyl-carrier-protein] hydrolase
MPPVYTSWTKGIVMRTDRTDRLRLICFPYAGVGASIFRHWAAELPAEIEVCPIDFPGRGARWCEPAFTRLRPLVEELADVLTPVLETRFAFFGHSMGAVVAFELARELRRQNRSGPLRLITSAARAPQVPDPAPPIHALADDEFLRRLDRLNGIPREIWDYPDLLQVLLPVVRADLAVCETYAYYDEAPLDCSVSVYGGQHDTKVLYEHLEGWRAQTTAGFVLRMFPGDHFFVSSARSALLGALRTDLADAMAAVEAPERIEHDS